MCNWFKKLFGCKCHCAKCAKKDEMTAPNMAASVNTENKPAANQDGNVGQPQ